MHISKSHIDCIQFIFHVCKFNMSILSIMLLVLYELKKRLDLLFVLVNLFQIEPYINIIIRSILLFMIW